MSTETPSFPAVNSRHAENIPDDGLGETPTPFPEKIPDIASETLCRRIAGYLRGMMANGLPCVLAAELKRRYAKRSGYSLRHVDDVFPSFQKWATEFVFKKQRFGRSTCIVITRRHRPLVLTMAEIRRRLIGAICNHVAKSGRAHVGHKFLENFHSLSGIPPERIFAAWHTIHRIEGYSVRWCGRRNGKFLEVKFPRGLKSEKISHPENASGISPLRGKRSENSGGCAPGIRNGPAARSARDRAGGEGSQPGGFAPEAQRSATGSEPGPPADEADERIPYGRHARGDPPQNGYDEHGSLHRWRPVASPLHVCGRWVSAARITGKANFLVFGPLKNLHATFWRVLFRVPHARNFAVAALRAGFLDAQICAAYRHGLDVSEKSAVRDREAAGLEHEWHPREPSQAVSIAWEVLRKDGREDAARWADIFEGRAAPAFAAAAARAAAPSAENGAAVPAEPDIVPDAHPGKYVELPPRAIPPVKPRANPERPEKLPGKKIVFGKKTEGEAVIEYDGPDLTAALRKAAAKTPQTVEDHMRERKISIDQLLHLSRAEQQKFVREAFARQKKCSTKG